MTTPFCTQCHTRPTTVNGGLCLTCKMPARMVATQNPLQDEVDRLRAENERLVLFMQGCVAQGGEQLREIKQLREALAFYADERGYEMWYPDSTYRNGIVAYDSGEIAREALQPTK